MYFANAALLAAASLIAAPALAQTTPSTTSGTAPTTGQTAPTQAAPGQAAPARTAPTQTSPAQPALDTTGAAQTPAAPGTAAPTTTIAQALTTIPNHATLLRLVQAAKLDEQLAGPGPYTLLAPNDAAFARLPAGTVDTLAAPANVASLTTILKNHVLAGAMTEDQLKARIAAGNGTATLQTLSGQSLTATLENGNILLTDAVGNKSYIDEADLRQTNGVIHVTNGISLPKLG